MAIQKLSALELQLTFRNPIVLFQIIFNIRTFSRGSKPAISALPIVLNLFWLAQESLKNGQIKVPQIKGNCLTGQDFEGLLPHE